ncbi:Transcriptional effector CCR4-related protein [Handroanthus impetiginosus]|uniref:Transcriptional effector CCR4-related protein n=1 Tax=Handroanthus impetiginosus TaxID=429701 RepID=A0A2G9H7S5_9LAMI|nr:Transcriptional effector CCR4-related protein [Handroanthus impetiginosus]
MNRRPSCFRSFAVAATADPANPVAVMSCRPYFRGGRSRGRRGYSARPSGPASGDQGEIVSGDSHFHAVRDANRGFRPAHTNVPPPPQYVSAQQFQGPGSQSHRPGPPVPQQLPGVRPHKHPPLPNYQQFRPQQKPQQFKPRASKPPDYREWECAKPGPPPHCERFTVLSYNILADYLAMDHWQKLYFHIPHYILDWNWRKKNICFELGLWSADILCFQEVDRFQEIEAELKPRGYNGIWKMRTGDPADGCAIFWRVSRFKLLHEESIEYNKLGLRDNVAQIFVFESLNGQNKKNGALTQSTSSASSNRVIVCNIHVLFNPKRGDVKLGQTRVLLDRAHAVSKLWDGAPIVICGDFNCTPKSPLYNFITGEKLDLSELPREKVSGQYSSEIRPSRPPYPDFRIQPANDSQASAVNSTQPEIRGTHEIALSESSSGDVHSKTTTVREYVESKSQTLSETEAPAANDNCNESSNGSASCESTSADSMSSLNEGVNDPIEENAEDCDSFLSELHSTGESLFPADSDSSFPNQKSHSHG